MDCFRQLPIGQFVDGSSSWLAPPRSPPFKLGLDLPFWSPPIWLTAFWPDRLVVGLLLCSFPRFKRSVLAARWRRNPFLLAALKPVGGRSLSCCHQGGASATDQPIAGR